MAKRCRLADLYDACSIRAMLERRRLAARLCMGQSVAEMARLEGVTIERMVEVIHHPLIRQVATLWMAFLWRIRENRDMAHLEALGGRLAEHELETGSGPAAALLGRLWGKCGSPGRGLLEFVARRFCRLALGNMVRPPREPIDSCAPEASEKPLPSPAEMAAKAELHEKLRLARQKGMAGGLDLRYLPRNWCRGVGESLFRKLANAIECRHAMLVADQPKFFPPKPDPGPFFRPRLGRAKVWVPAGTASWRYRPPAGPGGFPGTFPVLPNGRVLPATVDLNFLDAELGYEPWGGKVTIKSKQGDAWLRAHPEAQASPAPT